MICKIVLGLAYKTLILINIIFKIYNNVSKS